MKLDLLDELISLGHGSDRSLDCVVAVSLADFPSQERLLQGVLFAQQKFPKTGTHEVLLKNPVTLQDFANAPLPSHFHLELAVITEGSKNFLALKMSHILGDAVSMILWLKAVLGKDVSERALELKTYPRKKDTPYRKKLNSEVWPQGHPHSLTRERGVLTFTLNHLDLNHQRLNDLMILSLLELLPMKRKAIWIPVNVRKDFWSGFGNGLSRLRVYPPEGNSVGEKIAHIRKQKLEAGINGEIALPPAHFDIQNPVHKFLYLSWLKRPWADWATISLSHLVDRNGFLKDFETIWGASNLMPAHTTALFAVTKDDRTDLTLSFDQGQVTDAQAAWLRDQFLATFAKLSAELGP